MAMYAINYDGLRKRDTYNELIDYIQFGQEKITYPDRFAKRIRESPQISNLLDGEGLGKGDMEEQQLNHMKEILKEFAVREAGGTAQFARAAEPPPPPPPPPPPSFTSHTRAFFGGHRGPGAAPASFNIGTPRAGSSNSNHPAPHYDDDLQDQAERVSEVTRWSASARYKRNQNNADRNRDNLNGSHLNGIMPEPQVNKNIIKSQFQKTRRNFQFQKKDRENEPPYYAHVQGMVLTHKDLGPIETPQKLQVKQDKRIIDFKARRNPKITPPAQELSESLKSKLEGKRASATQIAKKIERKQEPNTKRSRQKTPYGARQT